MASRASTESEALNYEVRAPAGRVALGGDPLPAGDGALEVRQRVPRRDQLRLGREVVQRAPGPVLVAHRLYAVAMAVPEPILSTRAAMWPAQGDWRMEPKWDGFRLLVTIDTRDMRAWSRRGTSLGDRPGSLWGRSPRHPAGRCSTPSSSRSAPRTAAPSRTSQRYAEPRCRPTLQRRTSFTGASTRRATVPAPRCAPSNPDATASLRHSRSSTAGVLLPGSPRCSATRSSSPTRASMPTAPCAKSESARSTSLTPDRSIAPSGPPATPRFVLCDHVAPSPAGLLLGTGRHT